ncbi:MAG: (4Fe-4S)-binding protein [Saprospiraceae bacterium]
MEKEKIKEYTNGEITIVWKPGKCYHAGNCVKMLPKVYNPKERPWIKIENATTVELQNQVAECPSGALTYYMNDAEKEGSSDSEETKVEVMENGPLIVHGALTIRGKDGNSETKKKKTAFCRCGHSGNKPYCDGAHVKSGFEG